MPSEYERSPREWPPLGLPTGSVRALLTLIVVAVVVTRLAKGQVLDLFWIETLLIALAHYFTSRRFISLPPETIQYMEQQGLLDRESHPLFLPRHSIRTIIFGAFVGLAIYLYRQGRLFEPAAFSLLGLVFAYLAGLLVRGFTSWWRRRSQVPPWRIWKDGKAAIVLLAIVFVAVPEFVENPVVLPDDAHKIALGLMLFYFGSR